MAWARRGMWALVRATVPLQRAALRAVSALLPTRDLAVVFGLPDHEENSLTTALRLARSSARPVLLLADDPVAAQRCLRVLSPEGPWPAVVRRGGVRTVVLFLQASRVFYTHGLYTSPRPTRGRVHVNLSHGTGPKRSTVEHRRLRLGAQLMGTNTATWGVQSARSLTIDPRGLRVVGNPRQRNLTLPATAGLRALGLGRQPLLLWAPTHREGERAGRFSWTDGEPFVQNYRAVAATLVDLGDELGVDVVVKPHPLDRADYTDLGMRILTTADVWAAGISMYQMLGAADALLSDYSSIFVDYLAVDRPIGLLCRDYEAYRRSRGFKTPMLHEVAAALMLDDAAALRAFVADVAAGVDRQSAPRTELKEALGYRFDPACVEELAAAADEVAARAGQRRRISPQRRSDERPST